MKPIEQVFAFPLSWPDGWPRTKDRQSAPYRATYATTIKDLVANLRLLSAENVVLSSNAPCRSDGMPFSDAAQVKIKDPGVAVYFHRKGHQQVLACDRWLTVLDNIRAIGLTVEALRAIDRAGATELLNRAFTGFKALPPQGSVVVTQPQWWHVLGVQSLADAATIKAAYRKLAAQHHPDVGGDDGAMARINQAYEQAKAERAGL